MYSRMSAKSALSSRNCIGIFSHDLKTFIHIKNRRPSVGEETAHSKSISLTKLLKKIVDNVHKSDCKLLHCGLRGSFSLYYVALL